MNTTITKTVSVAALMMAGLLLTSCTPAAPDSPASPQLVAGTGAIEHIEVVQRDLDAGPYLLVNVEMSSTDSVSADSFRQVVTEALEHTSHTPSLVGLVFIHDDEFVNSQAASDSFVPGLWFNAGGPVMTGEQAERIAAG